MISNPYRLRSTLTLRIAKPRTYPPYRRDDLAGGLLIGGAAPAKAATNERQ
jgi:hypothetical protein